METKVIARVNHVDIYATSDEQQLVPVRPICIALGVDFSSLLKKLKEDPDFSSVVVSAPTTGSDGKSYQMVCLPVEYIYGWMFTIHPANVSDEAREPLRAYRRECMRVLKDHFTQRQQRQTEQNRLEIELLGELADCNEQRDVLNRRAAEIKRKLSKLREERLADEPTLF